MPKVYSVVLVGPSEVLNNNSWDVIHKVSESGKADSIWSVGDCKSIILNGTVGHLSFSNYTTYVFIIGINHNMGREGSNRIHFQIGKTAISGGTDICFCDSYYNSLIRAANYFSMNVSTTNSGGWASSQMRTNICGTSLSDYTGTFIAAIPADLRAVLKLVIKYTNNRGSSDDSSGAITGVTDYLFLLAEFEVQGAREWANRYEQNYQTQYDYYKAGNSKAKYCHDVTSDVARYWCRSANYDDNTNFCIAFDAGSPASANARASLGVSPCFCV